MITPVRRWFFHSLDALRHYIRQRARYQPTAWDQVKMAWNYLVLLIKMQLARYGLL